MNYIIIRPGIPVPTEAERKLILKISNGGPALGGPIVPDSMSGTFSIISSDLTKEENSFTLSRVIGEYKRRCR